VKLTGQAGGTSSGTVNLDVTARDVCFAASQSFFLSVTLFYTFTPLVTAGGIPLTTRTVTFTLAAWP
jgi:hypothetical protein